MRPPPLPDWSRASGRSNAELLLDSLIPQYRVSLAHVAHAVDVCSRSTDAQKCSGNAKQSMSAGMLWQWDLSRTLGWAHNSSRQGCWHSWHGLIEARREEWSWPLPLGVVPWTDTSRYVAALPQSNTGAFVVAGVSPPCRADRDATVLHAGALGRWQRTWDAQAAPERRTARRGGGRANAVMLMSLSGAIR